MKSDNVKKGMQQAPHRSLFNALGFTEEEMNKPMVGIVSSYNEIVPGHMNLDKIVNAVKLGVAEAGGVPVVFPAIAVCDGIAMGHIVMKYSLVTRDLIADSTECMALAHQFDALVMVCLLYTSLKFGLTSLLSLGIAAVIFLPAARAMLGSYRLSGEEYRGISGYFLLLRQDGMDAVWKWVILGSVAVPLLFFVISGRRKREHIWQWYLVAAMVLPVFFEAVNLIWHRGTYVCLSLIHI